MKRPKAHEVDTKARRIVPLTFPDEWEHREQSGRDYGIDMIIELFEDGISTGNQLLLQIKGTSSKIDLLRNDVSIDVPVKTLKYSEMFITPLLLIYCPVLQEKPTALFLWMQEYIKVILDNENPNWRNNKETVRVRIPKYNIVQHSKEKLRYMSTYPKRQYEWCRFAKIMEDYRINLHSFICYCKLCYDNGDYEFINNVKYGKDIKRFITYLNELISLKNIFNDSFEFGPNAELRLRILPVMKILNKLDEGFKISKTELEDIINFEHIGMILSMYNDYDLSWESYKFDNLGNF